MHPKKQKALLPIFVWIPAHSARVTVVIRTSLLNGFISPSQLFASDRIFAFQLQVRWMYLPMQSKRWAFHSAAIAFRWFEQNHKLPRQLGEQNLTDLLESRSTKPIVYMHAWCSVDMIWYDTGSTRSLLVEWYRRNLSDLPAWRSHGRRIHACIPRTAQDRDAALCWHRKRWALTMNKPSREKRWRGDSHAAEPNKTESGRNQFPYSNFQKRIPNSYPWHAP